MVLGILEAAARALWPTQYTTHIVVAIVTILVLRAFSQGRTTNRERDLHGRRIIVTGGFTPLGLTLLQSLAQRGAHIIALSPYPIDAPNLTIIIDLLRTTTSNEQIYAEYCDLTSPHSIRSFCTQFLTGEDQKIDAIIYAHEYQHLEPLSRLVGSALGGKWGPEQWQQERESKSLATFLMTTLLLPALLVAPVERDIRVITVVNRFYAAAAAAPNSGFAPEFTAFSVSSTPNARKAPTSLFLAEGTRSLRTIIFTRHLQRILDALPSSPQPPQTNSQSSTVPVISPKTQKSNIVTVSVSPGISRMDTISPLLNADWNSEFGWSWWGVILYILTQPLLRIFTKTPTAALQSVLHALFLPTPFKLVSIPDAPSGDSAPQAATPSASSPSPQPPLASVTVQPKEVLKPGALYAECAVVPLKIATKPPALPTPPPSNDAKPTPSSKSSSSTTSSLAKEEILTLTDDGDFGGEEMGRWIWEAYEDGLKAWEKAVPAPPPSTPVPAQPAPSVAEKGKGKGKQKSGKEMDPVSAY